MAFSMIVLITSLTPRVTFSSAGDAGPGRADRHGDQQGDGDPQEARQ